MPVFQYKKESIVLVSIFAIGVALICTILFSHLSFPDSSTTFSGKNGRAELTPGKAITQTFVAKQDNLNQLNIIINRGDLGIREKVHITLKDATCTTTLASEVLSWWTPDPFIYHHFSFEAIRNSSGQEYCLSIVYESTEKRADRPSLATNESPQFAASSYTNTGKGRTYEGRSLIFRPAYTTGSFAGDFSQLIHRLSQYKPLFLKDVFLIGILALFLILTFLLATYISFKNPTGNDTKKEV